MTRPAPTFADAWAEFCAAVAGVVESTVEYVTHYPFRSYARRSGERICNQSHDTRRLRSGAPCNECGASL
ncbi:MAG: hypothetical protein ACTHMS_13295 [Jatrophihabitans sp.]|uniref:hypothetical protein n=1 Tax=Jatrophihabitans sp. TaxID=1932789 RepID=UPI003F7E1DE2